MKFEDKIRIAIFLTPELKEKVEDIRYQMKFRSNNVLYTKLIEKGVEYVNEIEREHNNSKKF